MARILYFDCFSGISGDMVLGAFLDVGLPLDDLKRALGSLAMSGFDVTASRVLRAGVSATQFRVREHSAPSTSDLAPHPAPRSTHDHDHAHHNDDHEHHHNHDHGGHPHRSLP